MNLSLMLFMTAFMKMLFNSSHLLSLLISLELMNLSIIILSWQVVWSQTIWFIVITVIHSVFGMLLLLLLMRQVGNDKSINFSVSVK
uniref:NADH dehydrogenase subunit 4L n=1 Tax=Trichuris sp. GHL-2013 TaxID=1305677 RepID=S4U201_9BILA|nr:NADH dehydrogenase subunit 4L [Trichuris sp. GHL-2013]